MALGKCRECSREVSKSAGTCPGCGVKKPVNGGSWLYMIGGGILVVGALGMCSAATRQPKPPTPSSAMAIQRDVTRAPEPTASAKAPESATIVASAALLVDDELYACVTHAMQWPPQIFAAMSKLTDASPQGISDDELSTWLTRGASETGSALEKRHKGSATDARPKGTLQLLTKSCDDQFARQIIANCDINLESRMMDAAPPIKITVKTAYYLIPDDLVMSHCIAAGGDWREVAHDSREYLYAKSQAGARVLKKRLAALENQ